MEAEDKICTGTEILKKLDFFKFFVIKNPNLHPDPDLPKNVDPDPDSMTMYLMNSHHCSLLNLCDFDFRREEDLLVAIAATAAAPLAAENVTRWRRAARPRVDWSSAWPAAAILMKVRPRET